MAIEQIFEALPLHYLQHGISKFGAANVAFALFVIVAVGIFADYAWMLRLRSRMVSPSTSISSREYVLMTDSLRDHFPIQ